MSHFAVINNTTRAMNLKVSRQVSEYTGGLRQKMTKVTNIKQDYDKMFGDFADKKLAKDDLYYSIKNEIEAKEKEGEKKVQKGKPKNQNANILPTVYETKIEQIQAEVHKQEVDQLIKESDADKKQNQPLPQRELNQLVQLQQHKMAFQGDFDKLDEEIRCQLKAIKENDFEIIKKIHAQEMTANEQKKYLMTDEKKKELQDQKYDSDLDRTMFQEFWTELRTFKEPERKSQSVVKQKMTNNVSFTPTQAASNLKSIQNRAYGTSSKGIAGPLGALIDYFNPDFSINVVDPNEEQHKEIDKAYVVPKMKFDSIFEEYVAKRKQFDSVKQTAAAQQQFGGGGGDDSKSKEIENLQNKILVIQKAQEIEMRHAKEVAAKNANELLKTKLSECRFAYEEEFEYICKQFEEMQSEVLTLKNEKILLKRRISEMENIIIQQSNMMENCGYYLNEWEKKQEPENEQDKKIIEKLEDLKQNNQLPKKAIEMFNSGQQILKQEFSFYSFSVSINPEQAQEIMHQVYPKTLEARIIELLNERDIMANELTSTRKMVSSFKKTEEQSNKKIFQLQASYQMLKEEFENVKSGYDKRFTMLIRAFVKTFDNLAKKFLIYKDFAAKEIDLLELIIDRKDSEYKKMQAEVGEYETALRIPRQHYKHIEKLRFEEIMKQRDQIIEKIKKRYGVDPTKSYALLKMPDPSLPPEQQMEMITNGALAGGSGNLSSAQKPGALNMPDKLLAVKSKLDLGSPRMQNDFSIRSLISKTTADTKFQSEKGEFSLIMSPSVKFGLQINRRNSSIVSINQMQSPKPSQNSTAMGKNDGKIQNSVKK